MLTYPPDPCVFHPLPSAPHFVGRDSELEAVRAWWRQSCLPVSVGAAEAGHVLGQALANQADLHAAVTILQETRALRLRLEDPKVRQTEERLKGLLKRMPNQDRD